MTPVKVTKSASFLIILGIRFTSSFSISSSSSCLLTNSSCSVSRLSCSFFLGNLFFIIYLIQMQSYKGLANIGAICYINSFIQTLFMTPEFRDGIYSWVYNEKIHPKREDSILFQMQKLFGKLELGCSDINIKQLMKSFQWQDEQAFNQQDIQQFNRLLFQALEKSLCKSSQSKHLIKQLYEGELIHFTKCLECHNESVREEHFQDIILTIKNIYEKIYNPSLEHSLQRYIKPQLLDENNLYDCSHCNKKVRAQRGVKFITLPQFLNVVLQRFHFDYETFTRNKINDKFTFPFVLNFNNFFNGYEQIPNKLSQDSTEYFLKEDYQIKKPTTFKPPPSKKPKVVSKNGTTATQPAVAGKVKTKPSANTKSFLAQMRKKKMQQVDNDDLVFVSGNATVHPQLQIPPLDIPLQLSNDLPPPPPLDILNFLQQPTLSAVYTPIIIKQPTGLTIQKQIEGINSNKLQQQKQKDQRWQQQQLQNKQQIHQYLKDGPLVYQLYSVLVHSGTANAGHYYSYIKSSDNCKWYQFNDQRVTSVTLAEIQKSFGGSGLANAYVLYYRLYQEERYKLQYSIPQYITKSIKQEEQQKQQRIQQKSHNLQSTLILKIYFQLGVKSIQINKSSTLELLFEKCKQMFNIRIIQDYSQVKINQNASFVKSHNIRIRLFNPVNDTKLDTYTGKQQMTLNQIGIRSYQNLLLQVKADSEEFQEFIAGFMSIRVALWEDNPKILSLDEKDLKLHKVSVGREWNMKQVEQAIATKRKEFLSCEGEPICIIKRHQNDEYLYHQVVNSLDYAAKTIESVGIFQAEILFIEKQSNTLNWPTEFQNQIHRITIKVNSHNLDSHSIVTDSRITLLQLKQTLCALINQHPDQTIIRRGNRSGIQLKNTQASLKENRFISGTTLFLQKGIPAKMGEIRIQLFLASDASAQLYNRLHEFQFITDVPIDTNLKASEIKEFFCKIVKKFKDMELSPQSIRIREKVNDKMGKIYREKPMKEQQIIEKRQIAIQIAQDKLELKDFSIYVRLWDQHNWKLSQKYQIIVNKNTTINDLAIQIYSFANNNSVSIHPQEMDICRILSIHKFSIIDLVDMQYFGMISDACVLGQPLFVNSDGLLYIVKQTGIEPRELTKHQEELFGGKIKVTVKPTRGRTIISNAKKQKGMVITVVEKQHEQHEQQQ